MSDLELLTKIIEIANDEHNPIPPDVILNKSFINDPRNKEIIELYQSSSYFTNEWEWHQIVRFALNQANAPQFMYDKLWSLLLKHRGSYDDYFELDTELGTFPIPNALTNLNKLESLYVRFFEIFQDITNHIHFDYPKKEYYGPSFRGKINWERTIQRSSTEHPLQFQSVIPFRKFDTPENVLLVLCLRWLHKECERILQLDFPEPLSAEQKKVLEIISTRTKNMILNFPFNDIIKTALKFWNLEPNDKSITALENKTKNRMTNGIIRNKTYSELLNWIEEFRNLNLMMISKETPVRNLLRAREAQDTIFEAWIFLEIFDYFAEFGYEPTLHLESKPYFFEFDFKGKNIKFFYEKQFNPTGEYTWALQHKPDYTVIVDGKIIGVFDAKNFSKGQEPSPAINKILAYMLNFNTKFGVLFFPFLPGFWDEWSKKERHDAIFSIYARKYPDKTDEQLRSIQKPEIKQSWDELDLEVRRKIPINSIKLIPNPKDSEMFLYLMRMEPNESNLTMKNQTVRTIFEEIRKRI